MTRIFQVRAKAIEQLSAPTFSTNAVWNAGVWDGQKYDSLEGYLAADRSSQAIIYQGNISGTWDLSRTFYVNNPSSSVVAMEIGESLRARYAHIRIQGTSGDTPTAGNFRLVTWGKSVKDNSVSGQPITAVISGAPTVLTSGPVPVNMSGQVIKVWQSGAVTVLASGPVPINPGVYAFNISGAVTVLQSGAVTTLVSGPLPVNMSGQEIKVWQSGAVTVLQSGAVTVLVSGPLVVKNSGQQVQSLPPEVVKVWHPFGQGQLTSGGEQYGTELSGAASTYTVVQAATITNPTGYIMEEIEAGLTMAVKSTGSGYSVLHKWQASDNGTDWQDLTPTLTKAANAIAYSDQSVAGRIMFSGNFLATGATFQVRGLVAISDTSSGELAYGKIKNSTYLLARYRRS